MLCDYKISSIARSGGQTNCKVRFYSGEVGTEQEGLKGQMVTRYRRNQLLGEKTIIIPREVSESDVRKEADKEMKKVSEDNSIPLLNAKNLAL